MSFGDWLGKVFGKEPEPDQPRLELPKVKSSAELLAELEQFEREIAARVPAMVISRVSRVTSIVRETIPRLDQLGAGSYQAHTVVATATSYLPEAVGGYLRLPRSWADTRPIANGKTALLLLCDQLDLLAYKMDQILDAVVRADAAALVAHGQFLAEKFAVGSSLELGGQINVPAQPSLAPQPPAAPGSSQTSTIDTDDEPTSPPLRRLDPPGAL
ncbi:hypothetical protein GCM10022223_36660 [Kineosporia mesophila]|uniref:Uncharacterized protein n=1 Tax=Kineosporia mesophila TaxID=566012 RepID=A0ABP6ZU96_9ACTN|nr:hypothetical protein [Kineosporia mesophila]MCD5349907.1 hypothetical protein [Kineosporia mesophila]